MTCYVSSGTLNSTTSTQLNSMYNVCVCAYVCNNFAVLRRDPWCPSTLVLIVIDIIVSHLMMKHLGMFYEYVYSSENWQSDKSLKPAK